MEHHGDEKKGPPLRMRLFVAGDQPNSRVAKATIERVCRDYLQGRYSLEVVDVLEDFRIALEENVLVAPTLVIYEPSAQIRIVGGLSDPSRLLKLLGIQREGD
ncbi:MAG: circadian clock KaiB family protein [bacterium]